MPDNLLARRALDTRRRPVRKLGLGHEQDEERKGGEEAEEAGEQQPGEHDDHELVADGERAEGEGRGSC
jgi:hypothetical protein